MTRVKYRAIQRQAAPWLNWIEQPPPKGQVAGSNPAGVTKNTLKHCPKGHPSQRGENALCGQVMFHHAFGYIEPEAVECQVACLDQFGDEGEGHEVVE